MRTIRRHIAVLERPTPPAAAGAPARPMWLRSLDEPIDVTLTRAISVCRLTNPAIFVRRRRDDRRAGANAGNRVIITRKRSAGEWLTATEPATVSRRVHTT